MKSFLRSIANRHIGQVRSKCTNNIDSYHHTLGSVRPSISTEQGAVTLVNMRFCPYAQRTVLCLNAKNVDFQVINCQLMSKVTITVTIIIIQNVIEYQVVLQPDWYLT